MYEFPKTSDVHFKVTSSVCSLEVEFRSGSFSKNSIINQHNTLSTSSISSSVFTFPAISDLDTDGWHF